MGLFGSKKSKKIKTSNMDEADKEAKAVAKQRLLETEGGNEGAILNQNQGQSVRRIFG